MIRRSSCILIPNNLDLFVIVLLHLFRIMLLMMLVMIPNRNILLVLIMMLLVVVKVVMAVVMVVMVVGVVLDGDDVRQMYRAMNRNMKRGRWWIHMHHSGGRRRRRRDHGHSWWRLRLRLGARGDKGWSLRVEFTEGHVTRKRRTRRRRGLI
jgi:hypothetical protein